jgi:hypothetical protein
MKHHAQHGDIVVGPGVVKAFSYRPFCFSDAEGNLYDQMGDLVQPVPGGEGPGGGDNEGPGGGGPG